MTKQNNALRLANVCSNLTRYSMDAHLIAAELRRQHDRIAELEAELEAVGAGGVQALSAAPAMVNRTQHNQFLSDVLTAAGLVTHGKQCKALGERLGAMVMRLRAAPQQEVQEPAAFIHWPINGPPRLVWYSQKALNDAILKTHEDGYKPDVKLYTAPQPAPAPLSEMPYEKRKAIQEGASDAWFHARHNMLDTLDRRNVFRAGFDRGWNAAIAAQGGK